jgi:hypothetical protein
MSTNNYRRLRNTYAGVAISEITFLLISEEISKLIRTLKWICMHVPPPPHTCACMHARARTHTHTHKCYPHEFSFFLFPAKEERQTKRQFKKFCVKIKWEKNPSL